MKRVAITTLGCKVNQFESAAFATGLRAAAACSSPFTAEADVYVINTCTVTARAGQQSRQLIRRALQHPGARVVVTGCYAQMAPETVLDLAKQPVVIIGNGNKHLLVDTALAEVSPDLVMLMGQIRRKKEILRPAGAPLQRTGPGPTSASRTAATTSAPTASSPSPGAAAAVCRWPGSSTRPRSLPNGGLPGTGHHRHQRGQVRPRPGRGRDHLQSARPALPGFPSSASV
jgi:hypothetical protein